MLINHPKASLTTFLHFQLCAFASLREKNNSAGGGVKKGARKDAKPQRNKRSKPTWAFLRNNKA